LPTFHGTRKFFTLRGSRLSPRSRWELHSSGLLLSEYWRVLTDVSVQPIGSIYRGQESKMLIPEDGTDMLSLNVGKELPLLAA
jgi:hypothetical protein